MIKIPHTDLEVSRLPLGCMGLGGGWAADTQLTADHERQAREFLDAAEEIDANFFDHANLYGRGRAEEVLGRALKERPSLRDKIDSVKMRDPLGGRPPGTPQRFDFSRDLILESVDAILARLRTDRLDILLLHRPDALWEGEEIAEAFGKLHGTGKVRYFGVSNQNRFQMEYLQSFLPELLVANQVEMSLLHHGFVEVGISFNQSSPRYPDGWEGTMEYCRTEGVLSKPVESPCPWRLEGEPRLATRQRKGDSRLSAEVRSGPRDHRRGHPASLASQKSGDDSARIGNYTAGSLAGLRQGALLSLGALWACSRKSR
jgi:predicted oxidoreductase